MCVTVDDESLDDVIGKWGVSEGNGERSYSLMYVRKGKRSYQTPVLTQMIHRCTWIEGLPHDNKKG